MDRLRPQEPVARTGSRTLAAEEMDES